MKIKKIKINGTTYKVEGKSAYEIACEHGFDGSEAEWLASLKGKDGKDGENGKDGEKGENGDVANITSDVGYNEALVMNQRAVTSEFDAISDRKNLMPKSYSIKCGFISYANGAFLEKNAASYNNYGYVDAKIPIDGNKNIVISYTTAGGLRTSQYVTAVAFYDSNGAFISSLGTSVSTARTIFNSTTKYITSPANARYISFSWLEPNGAYNALQDIQLEYGEQLSEYVPAGKRKIKVDVLPAVNVRTQWYGKKWAAIGDSITVRSGNYVDTVANALGMTATNLGISGANANVMRKSFSDSGYTEYSEERQQAVQNADLITIYGCINDFTPTAAPIGDLYNTESGTFIYNFKRLIEAVLTLNPTARIVVIGTHNAWDSGRPSIYQPCNGSDTVAEYVKAVEGVARYYGLYYIDMYQKSGINHYTGSAYLADGVHPNADGYAKISAVIESELRNIPN